MLIDHFLHDESKGWRFGGSGTGYHLSLDGNRYGVWLHGVFTWGSIKIRYPTRSKKRDDIAFRSKQTGKDWNLGPLFWGDMENLQFPEVVSTLGDGG